MNVYILVGIIISYIIGSIPFGYIAGVIFIKKDIRSLGSGNIGATNVFRVVGPVPGIMVFILDLLKGFVPVYAAYVLGFPVIYRILWGLSVVIGHNWTVFLRLRGGKGVATSAGIFLGLTPMPTIMALFVFLFVFYRYRYISAASIIACVFHPVATGIIYRSTELVMFSSLTAVLIIIRHRANIHRLLNGKENRLR